MTKPINIDYYEVHYTSNPDNVLLVTVINENNSGTVKVVAKNRETGKPAWTESMSSSELYHWFHKSTITFRRIAEPKPFFNPAKWVTG